MRTVAASGTGRRYDRGMSRLLWLLALPLAGCVFTDRCDGDLVYYFSGLEVYAHNADPAATYDVVVDAEGTTTHMTVAPGGIGSADVDTDAGRLKMQANLLNDATVSPPTTSIDVLVYLQNGDGDYTGPAQLTITVAAGGTTLASQTFTPSYAVNDPHGAWCPTYAYATDDMTLP